MYFMGSMVRYNESKNSGLIDIYSAVIKQGVTRCNELACIEHLGEELWRTAIDDIIPMLGEHLLGSDRTFIIEFHHSSLELFLELELAHFNSCKF